MTARAVVVLGCCVAVCVIAAPDAGGQTASETGQPGAEGPARSRPAGQLGSIDARVRQHAERLEHGDAEQRRQANAFLGGLGPDALPALLELRGHPVPSVRRWANQGVRSMGMQDPEVATAFADPHLVALVIRAYANPLDFKALPVITRFLGDYRMEVREAARQAIGRFGTNAIRQLREAYLAATGKHAERSWGPDRVARELYAVLDAPAVEEADRLFTRGFAAFVSGDLQTMKQCFDQALAVYPGFERQQQMASGYAAWGQRQLAENDLQAAGAAYSRALRLDPRAAASKTWQGRLAYIRSEQRLQAGVVDLDGYRQAASLDPDNAAASTAIDKLGGTWLERQRAKKRWARVGSVLILGLFALLLLAPRSKNSKSKARNTVV